MIIKVKIAITSIHWKAMNQPWLKHEISHVQNYFWEEKTNKGKIKICFCADMNNEILHVPFSIKTTLFWKQSGICKKIPARNESEMWILAFWAVWSLWKSVGL